MSSTHVFAFRAVAPAGGEAPTRRFVGTALAVVLVMLANGAGAADFSVNSTGDVGDEVPGDGVCFTGIFVPIGPAFAPECTFRAAIEESNAFGGTDVISFDANLPTVAGVVEIRPLNNLPALTDRVLIDGYSAPGYDLADPSAKPIINLGGNLIEPPFGGIVVDTAAGLYFREGSGGSVLRGLAIHDFYGNGVQLKSFGVSPLDGPALVTIEGCHFGIWRGIFYRGNANSGIYARRADGLEVGLRCDATGCEGRRNVIADHGSDGIRLVESDDVKIQGNVIGTNTAGTTLWVPIGGATPNGHWGIRVEQGSNVVIGSNERAEGSNLISGNGWGGISMTAFDSAVIGNRIGTNWNGTAALGNGGPGIDIGAGQNLVGDGSALGGNLIAGNAGDGIRSGGRTQIRGNVVGLTHDMTAPLGNEGRGIVVDGLHAFVRGNTIGGNGLDALDHGLEVFGLDHEIMANTIGTNALGADLGNAGNGIHVRGNDNLIGVGGSGNTIGFHENGIELDVTASGNRVERNWIGVTSAGVPIPNANGISVRGTDNAIGEANGLTLGRANVIGENQDYGIRLHSTSVANRVRGNFIGTNAFDDDLGNEGPGIRLEGMGNVVGGALGESDETVATSGNVLAHNAEAGIVVPPTASTQAVRGNEFFLHPGLKAIDLGLDGPTQNDVGDVDTGANLRQNTPEFVVQQTFMNDLTGELEIRYRVNSNEADAAYPITVDLYLRTQYDSEADVYIGSDVYPLASATVYRSVGIDPLLDSLPLDGVLVATATDADGNTSELSTQWVPVPEPRLGGMLLSGALALAAGVRRRGRA